MSGYVDYIEYLQPIIDDVSDGEPLTDNCIDGILRVIRAKIEFQQGMIGKEEYETRIGLAYEFGRELDNFPDVFQNRLI